jgi:hypothetical protein
MVAITMLDTVGGRFRVPPRAAIWILGEGRSAIEEQLHKIPPLGTPERFWTAMRDCLVVDENRRTIDKATSNRPQGVSLLRAIDVVVWMSQQRGARPPAA